MKPGYETKTKLGAMMWLDEECHEVGQALAKTTRVFAEFCGSRGCAAVDIAHALEFALEAGNPELSQEDRESNRDWILREIQDLKLAIAAVEAAFE